MEPIFFASGQEFRDWLEQHHDSESEVLVGIYKKKAGKTGVTWADAVDQALCFGWIDSTRRRIDDERYSVRFTPRRRGSVWSDRNIKRVEALTAEGLMRPAGSSAFEARSEDRSRVYSFEQDKVSLSEEHERRLTDNPAASEFFNGQAPSYRRAAIHWVISAKREATRDQRMQQLIDDSAAGRTVPPLTRKTK